MLQASPSATQLLRKQHPPAAHVPSSQQDCPGPPHAAQTGISPPEEQVRPDEQACPVEQQRWPTPPHWVQAPTPASPLHPQVSITLLQQVQPPAQVGLAEQQGFPGPPHPTQTKVSGLQ